MRMNFHLLLYKALIFGCTSKKWRIDFTTLVSNFNALLIFSSRQKYRNTFVDSRLQNVIVLWRFAERETDREKECLSFYTKCMFRLQRLISNKVLINVNTVSLFLWIIASHLYLNYFRFSEICLNRFYQFHHPMKAMKYSYKTSSIFCDQSVLTKATFIVRKERWPLFAKVLLLKKVPDKNRSFIMDL